MTNGFARKIPVNQILQFVEGLLEFIKNTYTHIISEIDEKKQLTKELEIEMKTAIEHYIRDSGQEFFEDDGLVN